MNDPADPVGDALAEVDRTQAEVNGNWSRSAVEAADDALLALARAVRTAKDRSWTSGLPGKVLEDLAEIVDYASWHETLAPSQQRILTRVNNAVAAELLLRGPDTNGTVTTHE